MVPVPSLQDDRAEQENVQKRAPEMVGGMIQVLHPSMENTEEELERLYSCYVNQEGEQGVIINALS